MSISIINDFECYCFYFIIISVAMVDTCCDPTPIDYVIPANDDATKSIELIMDVMCQAINDHLPVKVTLFNICPVRSVYTNYRQLANPDL